MQTEQHTLQKLLLDRFSQAQSKNSNYSVRAFALKLGVASGTLSLLMLGKRRASKKLAEKIAARLMLNPIEKEEILSGFSRKKYEELSKGEALQYLQISADQFQLVSEWYYFAILNLVSVKGFKNDPKWIARRIGLSEAKVLDALERLKRLGLLIEVDGKLNRSAPRYETTDDVMNVSLRRSHYQTLELARESLERDPIEARDFTWLTVPVDPRRYRAAKVLIRNFQDELVSLLEGTPDIPAEPTEVYRLAVQFFPLTRLESEFQSNHEGEVP